MPREYLFHKSFPYHTDCWYELHSSFSYYVTVFQILADLPQLADSVSLLTFDNGLN